MVHFNSSEATAGMIFLAMLLFMVFANPLESGTWLQNGFWLLSWIGAQRVVASGARYTKPKQCVLGLNHGRGLGDDDDNAYPLAGKVAIVTGASGGIGFHTAAELAKLGATVIFGCRSERKTKEAMGRIAASLPVEFQEKASERLLFLAPLNLEDLRSVKEFAEKVLSRFEKIHLLVNNAGTIEKRFRVTAQGYERTTATNFLGPLLLTQLLRPVLQRTPNSRIVNVASSAHTRVPTPISGIAGAAGSKTDGKKLPPNFSPPSIPLKLLQALNPEKDNQSTTAEVGRGEDRGEAFPHKLTYMQVYGLSKLGLIYATYEISKDLRIQSRANCMCVALHPGIIYSSLFDSIVPGFLRLPGVHQLFKGLSLLFGKTEFEGTQTTLHCCTTMDLGANGYYMECKDYGRGSGVCALSDLALDDAASQQCYQWAMKVIAPYLS
jgi:NAD(P)-dependent dehydrogenase (short-subunit alcohol dehydrogenase family)